MNTKTSSKLWRLFAATALFGSTTLAAAPAAAVAQNAPGAALPPKAEVLEDLRLANRYFMEKWFEPGQSMAVAGRVWPSNIWTRAVYYEGLMALYGIDPRDEYYRYALDWAEHHDWGLWGGVATRNADNQAAGQTYIALYRIDPKPERIEQIKASIDRMLATDRVDDWDWIDAIQMAMPVFAELGAIYRIPAYWERMHEMYMFTRDRHGDAGLFNEAEGLWWRDADYDPPHTSPAGEDVYWSRGNGWVFMALARVLDALPADAPHRDRYVADFRAMAEALAAIQREDGFWNASLHDPTEYGGPETTGTAMFTYGMAWGMNEGLLDEAVYRPIVARAWRALSEEALHPNGFLGYVQSTGKEPSTGQPVTYDRQPDFDDYGLGAFLLAGTEVYRMTR